MLATGCGNSGFHPLYATSSITGTTDVDEKLAKMEVAPIPGRVGQRMRNELIFQSTGGGNAASEPAYRLEIVLTRVDLRHAGADRRQLVSGSVYNLNASFRLVRLDDKTVALQGESYGRIAFQRFNSVFSNVRARNDAEDRAAQTIAEDLKVALGGLSLRRRLSPLAITSSRVRIAASRARP